ncbi:MAG: BatA domain-containing protein [Daejeonella sp.]
MSFLFPGFLFALFALLIPVIIHLFNFRKFKKVYFSNVRFLKSIQQQTSSRQHLKDRLILLARMLTLAFLVFAFAKPYIADKNKKNSFLPQVVSVFIDNSYSMEGVNKEGTLLDEAKRRAKEIVSAYGLNDKFQLLTNDFEGKHQRLLSREGFENAVDEIKISPNTKNIEQIIKRQQDIFSTEPNARKTIYLISDFQKNLLNKTPVKADTLVDIKLVRLKANTLPNISIDSVWFLSPIHRLGENEKMVVKLRNNSDAEAKNVAVKLIINNQQKAIGNINIASRGSSIDTLFFSGLKPGWQEGRIEIKDYPVVFDDTFYFSFEVQSSLPVLFINQSEENPYLKAVYQSDPFFKVSNTTSGNINYAELGKYSLIILNEVVDISAGLTQQLKEYVKKGGTLMIFPALNEDLASLKNLLQALNADIPESIITEETKVSSINLQHPLFKGVFERIPQKMDLPVVKKYLRFGNQSSTSRQSILELPGRKNFFDQYFLGNGKVFLSAVPLQDEVSNFPRHSVFVPLMFQSALLSVNNQHLYYVLGQNQLVEIPKTILGPNQTLKLKNNTFETIPDINQLENNTQLYVADQLKQSGNYQLLKADSVLSVISFNDDGTESDLSYADDQELKSAFKSQKIDLINVKQTSMKNEIQSGNLGIELWKLCLILALICLAAEIILIRFYKVFKVQPFS